MKDSVKIQLACLQAMLSNPALVRWADSETALEGRITLDSFQQREALIFKAWQFADQVLHGPAPREIQIPTPAPHDK
jgi:hypothetical protein